MVSSILVSLVILGKSTQDMVRFFLIQNSYPSVISDILMIFKPSFADPQPNVCLILFSQRLESFKAKFTLVIVVCGLLK